MKKGFTLVELLAVIAILAILVIIALPNVMTMFNDAKRESFTTELKEIYKTAQQEWMSDSMMKTGKKTYANKSDNSCSNYLELTGRKELEYYIRFNKAGKVTDYYATDGTYQYRYNGGDLKIQNIKDVESLSDIPADEVVSIYCNVPNVGGVVPESPSNPFSSDELGELPHNPGLTLDKTDFFLPRTTLSVGSTVPSSVTTYYSVVDLLEDNYSDYQSPGNYSFYAFAEKNMLNNKIKRFGLGFYVNSNSVKLYGSEDKYDQNVEKLTNLFGSENCEESSGKYFCDDPGESFFAIISTDGDIIIGKGAVSSYSVSGDVCRINNYSSLICDRIADLVF